MDRARLWYEWVYALETTVSDADGWQQPAPPFLEVQATRQDPTTGDVMPAFDISLPAVRSSHVRQAC